MDLSIMLKELCGLISLENLAWWITILCNTAHGSFKEVFKTCLPEQKNCSKQNFFQMLWKRKM